MLVVHSCSIPNSAFLARYSLAGTYVDCYCVEVVGVISLPQYVFAFYTTRIFKLERLILKWFVAKPSNDAQAKQLAMGTITTFAAWSVEGRGHDQILLRDFMGSTRS